MVDYKFSVVEMICAQTSIDFMVLGLDGEN